MTRIKRTVLCGVLLSTGLAAQAALVRLSRTERPALRGPLDSIPMELGDWLGKDEPVDPDIVERSQTTDYLNRAYESPRASRSDDAALDQLLARGNQPAAHARDLLTLGRMDQGRVADSRAQDQPRRRTAIPVTRLGYTRGDLVEHVGFWYYIFGEGKLENYVRRLPITSRSAYGQATRGSSMTVETFYPGENDPEGEVLQEFAQQLLRALDPILPVDRANYYIP